MKFFGLHWVDVTILLGYIVAVLLIGKALARGVKGEGDFFLGGRSLGRWLQFFLSFGNMTDPGQATTTSSSVYRQGAGRAWLALITLFLTPYYWFMNVWFRRVRLTTMADLFADRFGSRFLATLYAVTMLIIAVIGVIAAGNVTALKTLQPLMVKEEAVWTPEERQRVAARIDRSQLFQGRLDLGGDLIDLGLEFGRVEAQQQVAGLGQQGQRGSQQPGQNGRMAQSGAQGQPGSPQSMGSGQQSSSSSSQSGQPGSPGSPSGGPPSSSGGSANPVALLQALLKAILGL